MPVAGAFLRSQLLMFQKPSFSIAYRLADNPPFNQISERYQPDDMPFPLLLKDGNQGEKKGFR